MYRQHQLDKKRKLIKQQNDNDDEQIKKTLHYFDSILDQYLSNDDDDTVTKTSYSQIKSTNSIPIQQQKYIVYNHSNTSSSSSSSFQHRRFEQKPSTTPLHHVRRYTSEDNLNQITSPSKPTTTITSTEDLSTTPSWKNLSSFIDKTNGTSASLIDLTSIDKLSSRPRFRFVPPSYQHHMLNEEPEIEPQFHIKTIPSDRSSFPNQTKPFHQIVKPTVIIPTTPKSAPINRLIETNIYQQNGNSAFKPHRSSKHYHSSKAQQSLPLSNTKRNELINKSNGHLGITNSNNQSDFLRRQQQMMPHSHQSLLDLSSIRIAETRHSNINGSRTSYQPTNKLNGHHQYHPPPTRNIPGNPISRWIQQVNNSSSISGIVHPSYHRPLTNGGGNRSQQQSYPSGSYMSPISGKFQIDKQSSNVYFKVFHRQ
jgi:hypothetical protein